MKYSQLSKVLESTKLSPEQLAPILGISNMTIRRWKTTNPNKKVPKAYERLLIDGIQQMAREGILSLASPEVQEIFSISAESSITAVLSGMGVSPEDLSKKGSQRSRLIEFLQFIGISETHRAEVEEQKSQIGKFKRIDVEWRKVITTLLTVIKSRQLTLFDKMIAYGALFYLICPLDLIPDATPVFGYMDDFALLSIATSFYVGKNLDLSSLKAPENV